MQICCENYKKHTECTHPKILVLISSKKAKVKSKCGEYSTDRTFLEQLVKHFFLYCCIL